MGSSSKENNSSPGCAPGPWVVLRAQEPSCPLCSEVFAKLPLRPSSGICMEWIHTDTVPSLCNLWEGEQGSQVDLFPWRVSASPINFRNCVFSPTYFGSRPPEKARPPERVCLSWGWAARVTLNANSCFSHFLPLPLTASLGPEPQDQTPQGKRAWFRYPRALLLTTATGHPPGCPWEANLGAAPEAGLPSAALRTFCHPGLGGGIFASLGCPSSFS